MAHEQVCHRRFIPSLGLLILTTLRFSSAVNNYIVTEDFDLSSVNTDDSLAVSGNHRAN